MSYLLVHLSEVLKGEMVSLIFPMKLEIFDNPYYDQAGTNPVVLGTAIKTIIF